MQFTPPPLQDDGQVNSILRCFAVVVNPQWIEVTSLRPPALSLSLFFKGSNVFLKSEMDCCEYFK